MAKSGRTNPSASGSAGGAAPALSFESLSYEEAAARLEEIIDRIESGEIGLEQSLESYERGMALLRHCRAILDRAEQKVSELTPAPADDGRGPPGARRATAG